MPEKILIVGHLGNMGKRYSTICNYLNIPWVGVDVIDKNKSVCLENLTGVIIATPTYSHYQDLMRYSKFNLPILCEKPITLNRHELKNIISSNLKLRMVNQYKYLPHNGAGESYYNYFKTGNDGLIWDCINIIGLSSQRPDIRNDSPIWKCQINGVKLNIGEMDNAYIDMVYDWIQHKATNNMQDMAYIIDCHNKVLSVI